MSRALSICLCAIFTFWIFKFNGFIALTQDTRLLYLPPCFMLAEIHLNRREIISSLASDFIIMQLLIILLSFLKLYQLLPKDELLLTDFARHFLFSFSFLILSLLTLCLSFGPDCLSLSLRLPFALLWNLSEKVDLFSFLIHSLDNCWNVQVDSFSSYVIYNLTYFLIRSLNNCWSVHVGFFGPYVIYHYC